MGIVQDAVTRIVNVHWKAPEIEGAVLSLGFSISKPVAVGDWTGFLKMTTDVTGLPKLSQTSFSVVADSFLPGETQQVSGEWTETDGTTIKGSANLTTEGVFSGGINYQLQFSPGSLPDSLTLNLGGIAPQVVDRNLDPMNVPIDLYINGQWSMMVDQPFMQIHHVIGPDSLFGGRLTVTIDPPTMNLT